jgi:steroid 5-alpha reductase family enzyme
MGNVAAVIGVVLLLMGVILVALRGDRRSQSWTPYIGVALAVVGLGVEIVGAVVSA